MLNFSLYKLIFLAATPVAQSPVKKQREVKQEEKPVEVPPEKPADPPKQSPHDVEVKMTHFVSPSEFYLQRAEACKQGLDEYVLLLHILYFGVWLAFWF